MRRLSLLLPLALLALACDNSTDALAPGDVAGHYEATEWTVTDAGGTTDLLDTGGTLAIDLDADGTTAGTVLVPGGNEDGSDYEASLDGSWLLEGSAVTFHHTADTFIRDVVWHYADGRLITGSSLNGQDVDVTLTRQ